MTNLSLLIAPAYEQEQDTSDAAKRQVAAMCATETDTQVLEQAYEVRPQRCHTCQPLLAYAHTHARLCLRSERSSSGNMSVRRRARTGGVLKRRSRYVSLSLRAARPDVSQLLMLPCTHSHRLAGAHIQAAIPKSTLADDDVARVEQVLCESALSLNGSSAALGLVDAMDETAASIAATRLRTEVFDMGVRELSSTIQASLLLEIEDPESALGTNAMCLSLWRSLIVGSCV